MASSNADLAFDGSPSGATGAAEVSTVLSEPLAREPERPALLAPDATLTYAQLDEAAAVAVGALQDLGLRPGDRLGVSLPNDSRIVVLFHAAMRLGAVWVGVSRALAAAEQRALLDDCGARVAVGCHDGVGDTAGRKVVSEELWAETVASARAVKTAPADPYAPAAIAYTSGTTGRPKGVVHTQHNLVVPGAVLAASRGYDDSLRKADSLPMTILNMLVLSTLLTSQAGGTAVISDHRHARTIAEWLRDTGANVWNGVPPILHDMAQDRAVAAEDLDGLVEVWSGGDNLSEQIRSAFTRKFRPPLVATYGLTEAPTVVSSEDRHAEHVPRCSGRVLPHLRVEAYGPDDVALPPGQLGELCVSASQEGPHAGVYQPMLGYWNDSAATAETLGNGVLHTGDVGTVSEDGLVFVHDRQKLVIVRGGANVYPAEVERVIQTFPGVAASAVVGMPDDRLGSRVGAIVQADAGTAIETTELERHCLVELARYKVPERWEVVSRELPRNPMGKIDRSAVASLLHHN